MLNSHIIDKILLYNIHPNAELLKKNLCTKDGTQFTVGMEMFASRAKLLLRSDGLMESQRKIKYILRTRP